jgi:hypothetical protein
MMVNKSNDCSQATVIFCATNLPGDLLIVKVVQLYAPSASIKVPQWHAVQARPAEPRSDGSATQG